jgi:dTDP-4-dehydrorhamnose reductase
MIWVVGRDGMLARDVIKELEHNLVAYIATNRTVNITDAKQVNAFAYERDISCIINCSGYTNVNRAEDDDAKDAYDLNVIGVMNLAFMAQSLQVPLIHISTDYVFDGCKDAPYNENDEPNPINNYGKTKLLGEECVSTICHKYHIVRTSWLYGEHGKNFVKTVLDNEGDMHIIDDQIGSPTWTVDLARAIMPLIGNTDYGVVHISGEGESSWFDFAQLIQHYGFKHGLCNDTFEIHPVSTEYINNSTQRPKYSVLSNDMYNKRFNNVPFAWETSLAEFIMTLSEKNS